MKLASGTPALELEDVWREFASSTDPVAALAGVSMQVWPGELVAVMGPSGSGKSTLLNLAGGLDQPSRGDVRIQGESTRGLRPGALARMRRRHLGFVFQELNLIESLTAAENVSLPLELDGVRVSAARREAYAALALVGLGKRADRLPGRLSGGEQQRVAIARALVGGRGLLLADEPTGALDTHTGDEVLAVVRERCDAGAAAVVVTHNPRHAAWADRVVFLRDGQEVTRSEYAAAPPTSRRAGGRRVGEEHLGIGGGTRGAVGMLGATGVEHADSAGRDLPLGGLGAPDDRP